MMKMFREHLCRSFSSAIWNSIKQRTKIVRLISWSYCKVKAPIFELIVDSVAEKKKLFSTFLHAMAIYSIFREED